MTQEYNLKAEIRSLGMTQKEFAKHIDKSIATIARWIKQEDPLPKLVQLYIQAYKKAKILDTLSVKIDKNILF